MSLGFSVLLPELTFSLDSIPWEQICMAQSFITPTLDDGDRLPQKCLEQIPYLLVLLHEKDFSAYNDHASSKQYIICNIIYVWADAIV
jgi:hypothetical protein